ncbi:major facilitator superfamily transporter [Secundilactobacillus pentosiphilus]|uniref:Major facilitator superfamily transporter n=1 Tax=Secundilactobacillus pentosiphilus TaxID=1714682 RepID=A0A1Z5ILB8_9LACO|nr:MFS transporter [Secundilactobacillus pentosiphilus]GAX02550.1 major facilitator superfamily transporter [Secundilactobacillus pentosiphilus]
MSESIASPVAVSNEGTATTLIHKMNTVQTTKTFRRIFYLAAIGLFLDAMDIYLASGSLNSFKTSGFSTTMQTSIFLSAGFLGLFLGSLFASVIGDSKGRMKAFQSNLLLFGLATFIGAFSPNMVFLIVTRFIAEIGLGAEMVTSFSIINEFAPIASRGKWCTLASCLANIGAPVAMLLCLFVIPHFSWRGMFFISGALAVVFSYFRHDLPESPRWNIQHQHFDEAAKTINQLFSEMKAENKQPAEYTSTKKSTGHSNQHLLRNSFVAISLAMAAMVCQYTFTSWVPTLLVSQGVTASNSLIYTTIMMVGAPIGAFIGSVLVERIGRKMNIIVAFCLVAVLGVVYAHLNNGTAVVVTGFLLTICFYILNATIIGVYITELFSTKYRFRGAGTANGLGKLANFGMPYLVVTLLQVANASAVIYVIAGVAAIAAVITAVFGPETKGERVN